MCTSPVTYEKINNSFVFHTNDEHITLNLMEVRQFGEWCRQINNQNDGWDYLGDDND